MSEEASFSRPGLLGMALPLTPLLVTSGREVYRALGPQLGVNLVILRFFAKIPPTSWPVRLAPLAARSFRFCSLVARQSTFSRPGIRSPALWPAPRSRSLMGSFHFPEGLRRGKRTQRTTGQGLQPRQWRHIRSSPVLEKRRHQVVVETHLARALAMALTAN